MSVAEEIVLDFAREERIGLEEAIFCAGKSAAQIDGVLASAVERGVAALLLTRLDADKFAALVPRHRERLDYEPVSRTAIFGIARENSNTGRVAVVCAGTSDVAVAREALRTLAYHGEEGTLVADVGVAGLWRLARRLDELRRHPVLIVAAGMDAALPSVLGGLVGGAIVAVPTSVGYGVAEGGHTALNAILASCAPGISVVNIDNGYGAACAALRILKRRAVWAKLRHDPFTHAASMRRGKDLPSWNVVISSRAPRSAPVSPPSAAPNPQVQP